ncbi:isochorismatase family protein [Paracoccus thiocyanatus]|uniref:isochorismatase family protein n=1 Tax=Paracoccus thiocyanatus TaxID=34006 RepID=UPI00268990E0|nr:isochorismatase family protein [Paracoccus thiocyanatus]
MPLIDSARSLLLLIDFQARLMPAIHEAEAALRNAGRLLEAAGMLDVPSLLTEQNPKGLGPTVGQLPVGDARWWRSNPSGPVARKVSRIAFLRMRR